MHIYFTDYFNIKPGVLKKYGAFNVSLINDLPLFIDPFLIFTSKKRTYKKLHNQIIDYLKYLRDKSAVGEVNNGLLSAWYKFPEVKQLWLGYSLTGNNGSGLGMDFAKALNSNLKMIFDDFGKEKITKGSHLEKVCLIKSGVGKDNVSDFTANLIKEYLLEYTQQFAKKYINENLRKVVSVPNVTFNYDVGAWSPKQYELPWFKGDYVLLTPKDMLTKEENWINRSELIHDVEQIANSVPDEQLRAQVNNYLSTALFKDKNKEPTKADKEKAYTYLLERYPKLIEYYIRSKENKGNEAIRQSELKVTESENFFIHQVAHFASQLESKTDFYKYGTNTLEEARKRVLFLKEEIENNGGYRLFYYNGKPIRKEEDVQRLFRLTWFASPSDFNSEVNNGCGPVDFKISRGSKDKSIVEFKLAKNTKLKNTLAQVGVYEKANRTKNSLKVIFYFSVEEKSKVDSIIHEWKLEKDSSIILIDARSDNKLSASKAKSQNKEKKL
jgi:hypothetical protein